MTIHNNNVTYNKAREMLKVDQWILKYTYSNMHVSIYVYTYKLHIYILLIVCNM